MSDEAIACAISPPIVPAPTTAALETNIRLEILRDSRGKSAQEASGRIRAPLLDLEPVARQRAPQRLAHLAADEERAR